MYDERTARKTVMSIRYKKSRLNIRIRDGSIWVQRGLDLVRIYKHVRGLFGCFIIFLHSPISIFDSIRKVVRKNTSKLKCITSKTLVKRAAIS